MSVSWWMSWLSILFWCVIPRNMSENNANCAHSAPKWFCWNSIENNLTRFWHLLMFLRNFFQFYHSTSYLYVLFHFLIGMNITLYFYFISGKLTRLQPFSSDCSSFIVPRKLIWNPSQFFTMVLKFVTFLCCQGRKVCLVLPLVAVFPSRSYSNDGDFRFLVQSFNVKFPSEMPTAGFYLLQSTLLARPRLLAINLSFKS